MKWWIRIVSGIVVFAAIGLGLTFMLLKKEKEIRTVTVSRQTVTQDIAFTGRIQSQTLANLSFESIGTVQNILVEVGDAVTPGQKLAQLDETAADIELAKAYADKVSAQEQKKISWQSAQRTWENLKTQNEVGLKKKRQAVRDAKTELDYDRKIHEQSARDNGDESVTTKVYTGGIIASETNYHTAQEALKEAEAMAKKAEDEARRAADLAYAQYLSTSQADSATAGISSLEALEMLASDRLGKKSLVAPFAGVVTVVNKEMGETVTVGEAVVTIETVSSLELAANVTETDASKISIDMAATVTFDALPAQDEWPATVKEISPGAKIIEGVPTYEVILQLQNNDERFKPGLTANITVHADAAENVLAIPRRAVFVKENKQWVWIKEADGSLREQEVETGLVGTSGTIEVTGGLSEGQQVVIDTTILE